MNCHTTGSTTMVQPLRNVPWAAHISRKLPMPVGKSVSSVRYASSGTCHPLSSPARQAHRSHVCHRLPKYPEDRTGTDAENSDSYKQASGQKHGASEEAQHRTRPGPDAVEEHVWAPLMPQLDILPQPCRHAPHPRPLACLVPQVRSQLLTLLPAARKISLLCYSRAKTRSDHPEVGRHRQAPAFLSEHEQRLVGAPQEGRRRLYRLVIGLYLRKQTSSSGRA